MKTPVIDYAALTDGQINALLNKLERIKLERSVNKERTRLDAKMKPMSWTDPGGPGLITPDSFIKRMSGGLFVVDHSAGRASYYAKTKTGILYRYYANRIPSRRWEKYLP